MSKKRTPETLPESTSSAEASPAKTSASQARARDSMEADPVFGSSSSEWFASYGPDGWSSRTLLLFAPGASIVSSGDFPASGTMRNGRLSALSTWERPTADSGLQSWPTPQEHNATGPPGAGTIARGGRQSDLCVAVRLWPTPTSVSGNQDGRMTEWGGSGSRKMLVGLPHHETNGHLNPRWVEWLMGFPDGWTDLEPSETP